MQLTSNDDHEDFSNMASLLHRPNSMCTSIEPLSCSEIRPTETVILVGDDDDGETFDEHSNLIDADQPQCRICLDTGGSY